MGLCVCVTWSRSPTTSTRGTIEKSNEKFQRSAFWLCEGIFYLLFVVLLGPSTLVSFNLLWLAVSPQTNEIDQHFLHSSIGFITTNSRWVNAGNGTTGPKTRAQRTGTRNTSTQWTQRKMSKNCTVHIIV